MSETTAAPKTTKAPAKAATEDNPGYLGDVPDQLPNEAYAVDADHADTAAKVDQQLIDQRTAALTAGREDA